MSYFFFLYQSLSSPLCTVFDSILSKIDEVLSINPSTNVFVFGRYNVYHKDWLTYSSGTDRPGELSQTTLFRCITFLLRIQTVGLRVLLFWISLFLLMLVFVLQWLYLHWEILIMLLSQFPLIFHQIHSGMPRFTA